MNVISTVAITCNLYDCRLMKVSKLSTEIAVVLMFPCCRMNLSASCCLILFKLPYESRQKKFSDSH
jgi:hypothetical protein